MFTKTAMLCLALNAYFEARGEGSEGIHAVTHVVMNRVESPRWPDDICEVVFQDWQFSWTMMESYPVDEKKLLDVYVHVVDAVMLPDSTRGATHYHNGDVFPEWAAIYPVTERVGGHTFYKALPGL
jgi:spore germination cell wall hydrolase CwlJ-like protein